MAKRYRHVGTLPVVVENYGRVIPNQVFSCEMLPEQELWFRKIRAIEVVEELAEGAQVETPPLDSKAPTSWPLLPAEQFAREGVKPLP